MKNTFLNLSNHQVQDILEELGMLDDNGNCPYTAEEIFKSALEYSASHYIKTNGQEWSEEDEKMLQGIWDEILANKHDAKECEWKTYDKFLDWLKSLKPQNRWKPSDEQLEALKNAIHIKPFENPSDNPLWTLYEQLKKLLEE